MASYFTAYVYLCCATRGIKSQTLLQQLQARCPYPDPNLNPVTVNLIYFQNNLIYLQNTLIHPYNIFPTTTQTFLASQMLALRMAAGTPRRNALPGYYDFSSGLRHISTNIDVDKLNEINTGMGTCAPAR